MTDNLIITDEKAIGKSITLECSATLDDIDKICRKTLNFLFAQSISNKRESFAVELLIREALTNAVLHGCNSDPLQRIMFRLTVDHDDVIMEISDEGPGFDWRGIMERPVDTVSENGRGLTIYRQYAHNVSFNEKGNTVILKRNLKKGG